MGIQAYDLAGLRLLVIVIPVASADQAYFFAGRAELTDHGLSIRDDTGAETISIEAPPSHLRGFDPSMLPSLMVPHALDAIADLVQDIDTCVAVYSDATPQGGVFLENPFFGLGRRSSGEVLLFQGDPSDD